MAHSGECIDVSKTGIRLAEREGIESIASVLKQLRGSRVRHPFAVVQLARAVLKRCGRLGNEQWTVREQALIAALDTNDFEFAGECERAIVDRFGGTSTRVQRLTGLGLEARGHFDRASVTYAAMLESNGANAAALKREICVLKGRRDVQGAVEKLTEYVARFQSDPSGWQELGETYVATGLYDKAIFCYEELVLFEPTNWLYHCRVGELHYTVAAGLHGEKKLDALRKARKHFAHCLHVASPGHRASRPAFGLLLAASAIGTIKPEDERSVALGAHAAAHLKTLYKTQSNPTLTVTAVAPVVAANAPPYR